MLRNTQIYIPTLVRIKPGALGRLGIYAARCAMSQLTVIHSRDLEPIFIDTALSSLRNNQVTVLAQTAVTAASVDEANDIFFHLPPEIDAVLGLGGGKALDVAKYVAFLSRKPYIAVPTALSNDGFSSPQSSLTVSGKKKSLPAAMPFGVVIDTEICLAVPQMLWLSGIGDLVAKITAVYDWKLAARAAGTVIDDFAALLSDATVFQFMARPKKDLEGVRLLGTALMLNGIAMEICGSSRPASGSEHLISHALDVICDKPKLHGIQVGLAAYLVSLIQGRGADRITDLFDRTGFWEAYSNEPANLGEWERAIETAPAVKPGYHTILSEEGRIVELLHIMREDKRLAGLFS